MQSDITTALFCHFSSIQNHEQSLLQHLPRTVYKSLCLILTVLWTNMRQSRRLNISPRYVYTLCRPTYIPHYISFHPPQSQLQYQCWFVYTVDLHHAQHLLIAVLQSPERVVVKVDHAVVAGLFTNARGKEALAASQRQITGYLVDSVGNVVRKVSKPGKPDKVCTKCLKNQIPDLHYDLPLSLIPPSLSLSPLLPLSLPLPPLPSICHSLYLPPSHLLPYSVPPFLPPSLTMQLVLGELLNASGLYSLDWESDSVTSRGRTYRERGCILRVSIFYQNWFHTWLGTT